MRLSAFAKINRSLEIIGRRDDGYHLIRSMMQAIDLHDDLEVKIDVTRTSQPVSTKPATSRPVSISVDMQSDHILAGSIENTISSQEDNIAYKAADMYIKYIKPDLIGHIDICIHKRIPLAAGFGGGSSNAAAVLLALECIFRNEFDGEHEHTPIRKLLELATHLGADVPFCLSAAGKNNPEVNAIFETDENARVFSTAAICEGIGEVLTPIEAIRGSLIIIDSQCDIPTGSIYSLYDEHTAAGGSNDRDSSDRDIDPPANKTAPAGWRQNDLERIAALASPETGHILTETKELAQNAAWVCITGSGPSIVCYYPEDMSEQPAGHDFDIISTHYKNRADVRTVLISKLLA